MKIYVTIPLQCQHLCILKMCSRCGVATGKKESVVCLLTVHSTELGCRVSIIRCQEKTQHRMISCLC